MKCNDACNWESGKILTVHVGHYRCNICGKESKELVCDVMTTDDYTDDNGVYRRKFIFVGRPPLCDCSNIIWVKIKN